MYLSTELRQQMEYQRTSADIVFECLGCKTSVYDRTSKADTYLALGVRELWLIDPETETIEVRHASKVGEIPVWKSIEILTRAAGRVACAGGIPSFSRRSVFRGDDIVD